MTQPPILARIMAPVLVPLVPRLALVGGAVGASLALAIWFGPGAPGMADGHALCPLPSPGGEPHQCRGRP